MHRPGPPIGLQAEAREYVRMGVTDIDTTEAVGGGLLPDSLELGPTHLTVTDLDRSLDFYEQVIGLRTQARDERSATLGTAAGPVLGLVADPDAAKPGRQAGLYHVALLYPSRLELARAGQRMVASRTQIQGASDHLTHEAFYLADPDGNGLELAADRPRSQWPDRDHIYSGGPQPLDVGDLMSLVEGEPPTPRAGDGVRTGHLHLHVGDIDQGLAFYRDLIGFEEMANLGTAAFVSAGGYHHHLGFNVWRGKGVDPVPEGVLGMRHWTVLLEPAQIDAVRRRLVGAGSEIEERSGGGFLVRDPWRNALVFASK
jgi:catechol 2,3-dioxygenase